MPFADHCGTIASLEGGIDDGLRGVAMLSAAPKAEMEPRVELSPAEDALMRAAFGRYGGAKDARAKAAAIVRKFQGSGCWFLCDCRTEASRPPALVPVLETFVRRHEVAAWPSHAATCDFYREPAEQAEINRSWTPLEGALRLARPWSESEEAPLDLVRVASVHTGRPRLARLLARLMTKAGLQRVGPGLQPLPSVTQQVGLLWDAASEVELDRDTKLAGYFCTGLAHIPRLFKRLAAAPASRFPHTRPHGVLVLRLQDVGKNEIMPLAGPALPVRGRIAVPGEAPEEQCEAAPSVRAPYLAICLVARPAPEEPVAVLSVYAHPCASFSHLMLVDSDLERHTLAELMSVQRWLGQKRDVSVAIEKPLEDAWASGGKEGVSRGPLIPDFVVSASGGGEERRVVVETMGYSDAGYRERKARMHPLMSQAFGGAPVVVHDFHEPPAWDQHWRDSRFWREVRWKLAPEAQRVREGVGEAVPG